MSRVKQLTMGADSSSPTPDEEKERIAVLRATVETYLPDFARGVEASQAMDAKESVMVLLETPSLPDIMTMSTPSLAWP